MARRFFRKMATLAKIEATYGVDAVPTGALNAIQMNDVTVEPMAGEEVSRDLYLPWLGNQGVELVGSYGKIEGSVELAGSGTAGTAPAYGPLLRACALSETIVALTSVDYQPVSAGFEAATLYFNLDGVLHVLLGARGSVSLTLAPKQIPRLRFSLSGLLGPITDVALPAVTLTAFKRPLIVSKVNTPVHTLHGAAIVAESIAFDLANQVEPRFLIGDESVEIVDRKSTGTAVIEAGSVASKDWFGIARARTRGTLLVTHGLVAGNIIDISAPAVEIGRPSYGQTQGITNLSIPLMLCSSAGDDEIKISVR